MKSKELLEQKNNKNRKNSEISFDPNRKIGNNKFICNNNIIVGKKYYHMLLSSILISIPTLLFASIMFKINTSSSITLSIIIIILYIPIIFFLFMGGCSDPGLVERNNEYAFYDNRKSVIKMNIKGHMINLNYCYTCFHFRPPRTSHCAECDNCVENFDHHCLWMGTCVGKRNYKYFYYLVFSVFILCLISAGSSIYYVINYFKIYFNKDKSGDILLIIISLCIVCFVGIMFLIFFLAKLLFLHSYLISSGITFYEYIKKRYFVTLQIKPYSRGCLRNIVNRIFKKVPSSKLDLKEIIKQNNEKNLNKSFEKSSNNKMKENENNQCESEERSNNSNDNNDNIYNNNNDFEILRNKNEVNNDLTATLEKQNSCKEKISSHNNNINHRNNKMEINNEEDKYNNESNEVNFERSINYYSHINNIINLNSVDNKNINNIININKKINDKNIESKSSEEKNIEFHNINDSNITRENIENFSSNENEKIKSEDNMPKPIQLKIRKNIDIKPFSGNIVPSKETNYDYYKNKETKIIRNELTQRIRNNLNRVNTDIQGEYICKTHNE